MRMILCDDHDLVVLSLTRLFERHGHEVVATAHRPAELIGLVERYHPDLCVLEVVTQGDEPIGEAMGSIAACARHTDVVVAPVTTTTSVCRAQAAIDPIASPMGSSPCVTTSSTHKSGWYRSTRPISSAGRCAVATTSWP